jgi:hypothetical protein
VTIIESYGDLFSRAFAIPGIGHRAFIGFIEDLFSVGVLAGIAARSPPRKSATGCTPSAPASTASWRSCFSPPSWGVVLAFAVIAVDSKHLHIALAPLEPVRSNGKVLDFEEADPDTDVFGRGRIEDFSRKGLMDNGEPAPSAAGGAERGAAHSGKAAVVRDSSEHDGTPRSNSFAHLPAKTGTPD